jgi:hypothetical protein
MNIGLHNENPLHASLKTWYARPQDRLEVAVDGYVIDILQGDRLVEIQTGNFAAIKGKVMHLVDRYSLRLVYPIAQEKWIIKLPVDGNGQSSRRKSPRRGRVTHLFTELVSFPELLLHPNFSLEVLMIAEEEVRKFIGKRRWRTRGWGVDERRLLGVAGRFLFDGRDSIRSLIPPALPDPFTSLDLAAAMGESRRLAQKTVYCLRKMELVAEIGTRQRSKLYRCQFKGL